MRFLFLLSVTMAFAQPAAAQAPSAEAFGRLPAVSDAAISPDGATLLRLHTGPRANRSCASSIWIRARAFTALRSARN